MFLGPFPYPNPIFTYSFPDPPQMENFRKPNFELVADLLYWMVKLYDPETTISDRVEFENERVEFLTSIATLMAVKARLKLNTKKLYASDGRAVQEMLKIATLLYKATKSVAVKAREDADETPPPIKITEVKLTRGLASDITRGGAKLYDFLATEASDRQERGKSLRFLDVASSSSEGSREHAFIGAASRVTLWPLVAPASSSPLHSSSPSPRTPSPCRAQHQGNH